jgi:hypothetical protein
LLLFGIEYVFDAKAHEKHGTFRFRAHCKDSIESRQSCVFVERVLGESLREIQVALIKLSFLIDQAPAILHPQGFDFALLSGRQL